MKKDNIVSVRFSDEELDMAKRKAKQAGIIGFDNIRLIDEIGLKLDSVAYDVESAAKAVSDYIISQKSIPASIQHKLVCRGSLAMHV